MFDIEPPLLFVPFPESLGKQTQQIEVPSAIN
jgi:hypothetical protein